jgi:DNA ligase (NAD+)
VRYIYNEKENLHALDTLKKQGLRISNPDYVISSTRKEKGPLEGLTIAVTGTLSKPRDEMKELIKTWWSDHRFCAQKN